MLTEQPPKILIVDDEPKNIQVLANILIQEKYQIEYATNGIEALDWIINEHFDLILLDIMMPEMDGFETCKQIKEIEDASDLPIIFLTAKTDTESIVKGFKLGGADYITKPFNTDELLVRVNTHLELKNSKDQLKQVNKWLEEKVAERTKELKIANEKLLLLDTAKSEFLSIISHEIRTPLNGIAGAVDIMNDFELPDDVKIMLEVLNESSLRLQEFSLKALDISNFNIREKETLKLEEVNIIQVLDYCKSQFSGQAEQKNISIEIINTGGDNNLLLDETFIQKCFIYIIDNAIKFGEPDSKIKIQTLDSGEYIEVAVEDIGEQFPENFEISNLKPFITKSHIDNNPGLSLYLCKQIIEAHNGEIEVRNLPKGAEVKVRIPKTSK